MPLFRTYSPPRRAPQMPLTRAPQYNEEAASSSTIFSNRSPERLRAESVTGSYPRNDSHESRSRRGLLRRRSSDSVPSDRRFPPASHPPPSHGVGGTTLGHQQTSRRAVGWGTPRRGHGGHVHDRPLLAAREKVRLAELAERSADQALIAARRAVDEGRRHLDILEAEANEQARLAHERILGVRSLRSNARGLGRYGP